MNCINFSLRQRTFCSIFWDIFNHCEVNEKGGAQFHECDSIQANICGSSPNSLHPKRDHIYAVEANHHDHTPTSISLSSQSFAQKCNSTPVALEHNHHSQPRQPQPQLIINTDQHSFRNSELTSVVIHHQETLNQIIAKPNILSASASTSAAAEDDNEDVIVIPQNGLKTHHYDKKPKATSTASLAKQQRRLSESDIILVFPQKQEQPQSISFLASEAASSKSEVCLSKAVQEEENRRLEATTDDDNEQAQQKDSIANATAKKNKTKSLEHIRI